MEPRDPARKPRPLSLDMSLDPLAQAAQVLQANPLHQDVLIYQCYQANAQSLAKSATSQFLSWRDSTYLADSYIAPVSNVLDVITN